MCTGTYGSIKNRTVGWIRVPRGPQRVHVHHNNIIIYTRARNKTHNSIAVACAPCEYQIIMPANYYARVTMGTASKSIATCFTARCVRFIVIAIIIIIIALIEITFLIVAFSSRAVSSRVLLRTFLRHVGRVDVAVFGAADIMENPAKVPVAGMCEKY